jgi:ParB/RepB/Spo0J family partition protein
VSKLIPLDKLHHHPDNPPERIKGVEELAESIRSVGILQALVVEPLADRPDEYVIVIGHRRRAAAALLGLPAVPCDVRRQHSTVTHTMVRLIENGHRRNLSPLEQAHAFGELRRMGMTLAAISGRTGFSAGHISTRLALLELDAGTQRRLAAGQIRAEDALAAVRDARGGGPGQRRRGRRPVSTPVTVSSPVVELTFQSHFGPAHPVFQAAAARCLTEHMAPDGVACPPCWEFAVRADERFAVELGEQLASVS